jgi:N-acyl-D-amino-acid deacylase
VLDLIIANGEVVDGSGRPRFKADVGLASDCIVAIEPSIPIPGIPRLEAQGRVVAPGFIDLHSHSDLCLALPLRRQAELLEGRVRQGITTELVGNCGIGCAPVRARSRDEVRRQCGFIAPDGVEWTWDSVGSYLDRLAGQGVLVNVAALLGHGAARSAAMGARAGRPTPDEQRHLDDEVRAAVESGAFGISFGLIYPPGQFADTDELVSAAKAAWKAGGFAAFHQRGSSRETLLQAVQEIVEVGRRSGAPVHHSHVETVGPRAWSGTEEVLRIHEEAGRMGVALSGDVIPYTGVCTTMLALYPPWSLDGGAPAFLERLRDKATRRRMREEVNDASPVWPPWEGEGRWTMNIARECGWDRIRLAHVESGANKRFEHMSLRAIGRARGLDPFEALSDLLLEENGLATQLIFGISGDEQDDRNLLPLLTSSHLAFVTDAWEIGKGFPHPGAYGAFPRILGQYARDRGLFSIEEAVRKLTSLPAARLGLRDRGLLRPGFKADLLVFDPRAVSEQATYDAPRRMPQGIDDVFVNGERLVSSGRFAARPAGRVLRRAA